DRNRVRRVKGVVLHDDDGARLARIIFGTRDGPDVSSPHSSFQSDTASMNARSWAAWALAATACDCRCASARKDDARTSGTQIWIGRRPWARSRSRCSCTLILVGFAP